MKVLFLYPHRASFIDTDLDLLRALSEVRPLCLADGPTRLELMRAVAEADLTYAWFAGPHSAWAGVQARLLGKKVILAAGGWDVEALPEIGYGLLLKRRGQLQARTALRWASLVLAFSRYSEGLIRGISPRCHVRTAYLAVDTSQFRPGAKEDLAVCVANVTRENLLRKGLSHIARASRKLAGIRFVLAGNHMDDSVTNLRTLGGPNFECPGRVSADELRDLLAKARVFVMPSYTEGFGVAIVEAMASGCVPVVTRRGAIPEVVGDAGVYVDYGDLDSIVDGIERGMQSGLGDKARNRVETSFGVRQRASALRVAIRDLGFPEADGGPREAVRLR